MTSNRDHRGARHSRRDHGREQGSEVPKPEDIQGYIKNDETASAMVRFAETFGRRLKSNNVTTSQIRNAYGNMKKLELSGWKGMHTQREVLLLKPRLAYAAGRHGPGMRELKEVMDPAIDSVSDADTFRRFCQFFEAIVAYHKAAGGK